MLRRGVKRSAICLLCGATAGWTASAAPVARDEKTPPDAIFLGNPSEVAASPMFDWSGPCVTFQVLLLKARGPYSVVTSGLADATLYPGTVCGARADGRRILPVSGPVAALHPTDISLRLDTRGLEDDTSKLEGRIVAIDDKGEVAAAAMTVKRKPLWIVATAFLWVLGILIPATVGFLIARWGLAMDRRRKQTDDFRAFSSARKAALRTLLRDTVCVSFYAAQVADADRAGEVWKALTDAEVVSNLPDALRARLTKAYLANRAEDFRLVLSEVLSEYLPELDAMISRPVGARP